MVFSSSFHPTNQVQIISLWLFVVKAEIAPTSLYLCLDIQPSTRHWGILGVGRECSTRVSHLCFSLHSTAFCTVVNATQKYSSVWKRCWHICRAEREHSLNTGVILERSKIFIPPQHPTLLCPIKSHVSIPGTFSLTFIIWGKTKSKSQVAEEIQYVLIIEKIFLP